MATEIRLPDLGDGIDSGDVLDILINVGDQIAKDQGIVELETDKATVEVPCTVAGKVTKVLVTMGQTVKVGEPLISVEASAGQAATSSPATLPPAAAAEAIPAPAAQPPAAETPPVVSASPAPAAKPPKWTPS